MQVLTEVLENELKTAFEVKDERALHRYVSLMLERTPDKEESKSTQDQFREAMLKMDAKTEAILLEMREGFKRMDERFEAVEKRFAANDKRFEERFETVDKRFDDVNKRFTMMFAFMSIGFIIVSTLVTIYQFLG